MSLQEALEKTLDKWKGIQQWQEMTFTLMREACPLCLYLTGKLNLTPFEDSKTCKQCPAERICSGFWFGTYEGKKTLYGEIFETTSTLVKLLDQGVKELTTIVTHSASQEMSKDRQERSH